MPTIKTSIAKPAHHPIVILILFELFVLMFIKQQHKNGFLEYRNKSAFLQCSTCYRIL